MEVYGLTGNPLSHSWSKQYFDKKFRELGIREVSYHLFPVQTPEEIIDLPHLCPELKGLNVTTPFKECVIPYLQEMDPVASEIGAVNTILVQKAGPGFRMKGFNTDWIGFSRSLPENHHFTQALILGTGGASRAVAYALRKSGIPFRLVSREPSTDGILSYNNLTGSSLSQCDLIIQATPLGMFPDTDSSPLVPYEWIGPHHFLYDLIYNPPFTQFLRHGISQGAGIQNGLRMLEIQADEAYKIWKSGHSLD